MAAVETFANDPQAIVVTGGTTAPASGTVENWTVDIQVAFPNASPGTSQFHVADPATGMQTEKILVTSGTGAVGTQNWTVTRGDEGTVPLAHGGGAAGWVIRDVVTAGWFNSVTGGGSGSWLAWQPSDDGILAANYDPVAANGGLGGTDMGILYLSRWIIRSPVVLNDLLVMWDAASLNTPSGSAYLGLYSPSGGSASLVTHTADIGPVFIADFAPGPETGRITAPLTGSYSAAAATYLAGFLVPSGWGGGGPFILDADSGSGVGSVFNWGTLPGNFRCGMYGSGLSTLPGTITLASIVDPTEAVTPLGVGPFWIGGR